MENRIWRAGVRSWEEFSPRAVPPSFPRTLAARIDTELAISAQALRRGRHSYFAATLPKCDHWRAWRDFLAATMYLDIETTGLSIGRDALTVVGLYDGTRRRSFIQGENLESLPRALEGTKMLVTFNGSRFDVPFLRRVFPQVPWHRFLHVDLLHALRRLGFRGGLKTIEENVGIERSDETCGLRGFDAVRLWDAHVHGDEDALDLLIQYNLEDVVNLEPLASLAYEELRCLSLEHGFVTADRYAVGSRHSGEFSGRSRTSPVARRGRPSLGRSRSA
jgi:uncharacterized protein YprB with RNaseH-like and TPR domain